MISFKRPFLSVIFASISAFSLLFVSCADSEADVISASATMVFDFADAESVPSSRLAVFFQVTNEVQRTERFSVSNAGSGYTWDVTNPGIFTGMNKNYAYALNLSAPDGEPIPVGEYTVRYYDAAGNDDTMQFTVNYDEGLLTATVENCKDFLKSSTENIAIYDEENELLFMGKEKKSWKTNSAILKEYRIAQTKRTCYVTPGNTIICILPAENLKETEEN